jgi:hypothetical protein
LVGHGVIVAEETKSEDSLMDYAAVSTDYACEGKEKPMKTVEK